MSASLVGSEMCIRDSAPPCVCGRRPRFDPPAWASFGWQCCRVRQRPRGTVSYTHLTLPTICSV
eukprot:14011132-Alexandrium_andersonii.AAC.1